MTTRSLPRSRTSTADPEALCAVVDGFLDRFGHPATVDRWRGWSSAAEAATALRHLRPRRPQADAALLRWQRFQATHGDL